MLKKSFYILFIIFVVTGCKCNRDGNLLDKNLDLTDKDTSTQVQPEVSEETMKGFVENISSPVEMAAMIKQLGIPFSKKYLAPTDNVANYFSSTKKAFNLGIFGADLGYLNMYNKTSSVVEYLSAIKTLADGIQVGQFFDFSTLKRLATNNQNIDSLMLISVQSFNKMDKHLRKTKRSNLSALMVAGVWIEGLYLATQVASESTDQKLYEAVGEQKIMLADLILLMNNYKDDKFIMEINQSLQDLKNIYEPIKITYEKGEPQMIEQNGELTIVQNEKSHVQISKEQLDIIIAKVEEIRNNLIKI